MPPKAREKGQERDSTIDRFPTVRQALSKVGQAIDDQEQPLRRIDIRTGAGGDVYYRLWVGREDEHLVGSVSPDE